MHQSLKEIKEASESYQSSANLLNILRANVQAEDAWKITLRELYRKCYQSLWRMFLKLEKIEGALYAAEEGRPVWAPFILIGDDITLDIGKE